MLGGGEPLLHQLVGDLVAKMVQEEEQRRSGNRHDEVLGKSAGRRKQAYWGCSAQPRQCGFRAGIPPPLFGHGSDRFLKTATKLDPITPTSGP